MKILTSLLIVLSIQKSYAYEWNLEPLPLSALFDARLSYTIGSRFNPLREVEWLAGETPAEWREELRTRDGKTALFQGLRLTGREFGVRHLGVRGFVGEMLSGKKVGTVRPSLFNPAEGIAGWNQTTITPRFFREIDPLRTSPYATFGYKKANWFGEPVWEIRTRTLLHDWQDVRVEMFATAYVRKNFSCDAGVYFQTRTDRNGDTFSRGEDQKAAVFGGMQWTTRVGTLFAGVSGPIPRASIAYWYRW